MSSEDLEQIHIRRFLHQLERMRFSSREATQARDLVVAVWVDCPKYLLPETYKHTSLPHLLDDAVAQLERNYGISLVTSIPRGLFGAVEQPFFWRPSTHLQRQPAVQNIKQVYGAILSALHPYAFECFPNGDTKNIAILSSGPLETTQGTTFQDYEEVFSKCSCEDAFEFIASVSRFWSLITMLDLSKWRSMVNSSGDLNKDQQDFRGFLSGLLNRRLARDDPYNQRDIHRLFPWYQNQQGTTSWQSGRDGDHCNFVYRIVCNILYIDETLAREAGLRVIVDFGCDREGGPRLGLANGHRATSLEHAGTPTYTITPYAPSSARDPSHKGVLFQMSLNGSLGEDLENGTHVYQDYEMVGVWIDHGIHDRRHGVHAPIFNYGMLYDLGKQKDDFDDEEVQTQLLEILTPDEAEMQLQLLASLNLLTL
ncbi:hypothetical protein KCU98_g7256, partial [Aureobasidium melanogenum]